MVNNFKSKRARDIFDGLNSKSARQVPAELHGKCRRLFDQLFVATFVDTLRIPPSNRLEKLKGDLSSFWSVRVNRQWRIIFKWKNGEAIDVDIVDYH